MHSYSNSCINRAGLACLLLGGVVTRTWTHAKKLVRAEKSDLGVMVQETQSRAWNGALRQLRGAPAETDHGEKQHDVHDECHETHAELPPGPIRKTTLRIKL